MSQIVDCRGVVPLKSDEALAVFYATGWVGGKTRYLCQVQRGPGDSRIQQWTGEQLDRECQRMHTGGSVEDDVLAEVCGLWREFRREHEDNQWAKKQQEKRDKVTLVTPARKADRSLIH